MFITILLTILITTFINYLLLFIFCCFKINKGEIDNGS